MVRLRSGLIGLLMFFASGMWAQMPSPDREAQEVTIKRIRDLGTAVMSWFTDAVSAAEGRQVDVADYSAISHGALVNLLVPLYTSDVPAKDGWGHRFEFFLPLDNQGLLASSVMLIRSPGREGIFDHDVYLAGAFADDAFDEDIVWADGYFVRWPGRFGSLAPQPFTGTPTTPAESARDRRPTWYPLGVGPEVPAARRACRFPAAAQEEIRGLSELLPQQTPARARQATEAQREGPAQGRKEGG